mmetsp:Transcript_61334/g.176501  ORF Transcript_61334/g.176501 Transcript_61334/m.176501 type:complete len:225 (+) Transcript_61334:75-749(+)
MGAVSSRCQVLPKVCERGSVAFDDACMPAGATQEQRVLVELDLLRASAQGNVEGILFATAAGADIESRGRRLMHPAGSRSMPDSDPSLGCKELSKTERGLTPLMRAANAGEPRAVRLLLRLGAAHDARDEDGMQPLHFAATAGCYESCLALLDGGADAGALDDDKRDAFACLPEQSLRERRSRTAWLALLRRPDQTRAAVEAETDSATQVEQLAPTAPQLVMRC